MSTTIAYLRKSTDQGEGRGQFKSVEQQRDACARFAESKGWTITETFVDDAVSGTLFATRPQLQALLAAAYSRKVERVIVWAQNRLGRGGETADLVEELYEHRVDVWVVDRGVKLDPSTFAGRIGMRVEAEADGQQPEGQGEAAARGLAALAGAGMATGFRTYGYRHERTSEADGAPKRRVPFEPEAQVVRRIFSTFAQGMSPADISAMLNREGIPGPRAAHGGAQGWGVNAVRQALARPVYRGRVVFGVTESLSKRELRRAIPGTTREHGQVKRDPVVDVVIESLRIVDPAVSAVVDARLEAIATRYKSGHKAEVMRHARPRALLSGILRCACGLAFEYRGQRKIYACPAQRKRPGSAECRSTLRVPAESAESYLLGIVGEQLLSEAEAHEIAHTADGSGDGGRAALQAEIAEAEAQVERLVGLVARGGVVGAKATSKLDEAEAAITRARTKLDAIAVRPVGPAAVAKALLGGVEGWRKALQGEHAAQRAVLQAAFGEIVLPNDQHLRPSFIPAGPPESIPFQATVRRCPAQSWGGPG